MGLHRAKQLGLEHDKKSGSDHHPPTPLPPARYDHNHRFNGYFEPFPKEHSTPGKVHQFVIIHFYGHKLLTKYTIKKKFRHKIILRKTFVSVLGQLEAYSCDDGIKTF